MKHVTFFLTIASFTGVAAGTAQADCQFSPLAFFPDRNDLVTVRAVVEAGTFCTIAFQEGPGYKFSSASFSKAPPHGVLAKTGAASFAYRPFDGYRGPDSYSLRLCATVRGKNGCSTLTYRVDVR